MNYVDKEIAFREIPDEITLAISISGCKIHCPDCHSKYLWSNIGEELTEPILSSIIEENNGITCVCFMGGNYNEVVSFFKYVRHEYPNLKTAWYTGESEIAINDDLLTYFDYVKVGPYIKERGGLDSKTTNQILYHIVNRKLENVNHLIH